MKSIGVVSLCQWCCAPLRGHAIDKTCHFRFGAVRRSDQETCSRLSLYCRPRLVWRAVAVIAVWTYMVVGNIGEFLHSPVHLLLCPKFIQVSAFVLQGVEVPLHWRIVVRVSSFAHALGHMDGFTEFYEIL